MFADIYVDLVLRVALVVQNIVLRTRSTSNAHVSRLGGLPKRDVISSTQNLHSRMRRSVDVEEATRACQALGPRRNIISGYIPLGESNTGVFAGRPEEITSGCDGLRAVVCLLQTEIAQSGGDCSNKKSLTDWKSECGPDRGRIDRRTFHLSLMNDTLRAAEITSRRFGTLFLASPTLSRRWPGVDLLNFKPLDQN
ncbi:hypothetical protein EVAR_61613_1 [Eumeta japonica]|uniref:Uncharacterized protein n=1 Tax=Eumeta variegata TaxID=151549 RepID=A0A4C1ZJ37_EUMVA|nr:hypothetical protein EVAR_61613_1 [Eumeta japonica]